jgi:ABC-2 type transport system ATP-binding protein
MLVHFNNMPEITALEAIEGIMRVDLLTERLVRLYFSGEAGIAETIVAKSVANGWRLQEITLEKNSVEEIFKQLSQN